MMTGKICTRTYVEEFDDENENIAFSIKPKIYIITVSKLPDRNMNN